MTTQTFSTIGPVAVRVRFEGGRLTIRATERDGATVDVQPTRQSSDIDVDYAERTVVEQHGDEIRVLAPDDSKRVGRERRLDVTIEVPERSIARVAVVSATVRSHGTLGDVEINTASGDIGIDHAGAATISSASGDIACTRTDGELTVKSASGDVRFSEVGGDATIATASGDIFGLRVVGTAELRTASGDAKLDVADGPVHARTASGELRLGAIRRGNVEAASASGDVTVRVVEGTAAWLDVHTLTGDVVSDLEPSSAPADADGGDTVTIHIRTISGDIAIRRAG